MNHTLLIVDDEPVIRRLLTRMLELEGYEVHAAADCAAALRAARKFKPCVVLCDVFLPDGNGVDMVPQFKEALPACEVVLLTAHGNIEDGVQAIKNGAFDYIVKGDDNRKIIPLMSRAVAHATHSTSGGTGTPPLTFGSILGTSPRLQQTLTLAHKVAATEVPVLLTGETGTGKEMFAQAIHAAGARRERPFLAINCSAFSKDLLESELFGHLAGAFTGATTDKKGLFEAANGGTLFLDEIGEMDTLLQSKLLRVLEAGEYIKIGDTQPTRVDVRIISATNRDLKAEIAAGRFRNDLYYRLSVFHLPLPPLRERRADIRPLAEHFLQNFAAKLHKPTPGMTAAYVQALERADWPGNVRELKNVVERSAIVSDGELTVEDLPLDFATAEADGAAQTEPADALDLATIERRHIARVLAYTGGNKTEAARRLKIGLTTLYRKIEEYGL